LMRDEAAPTIDTAAGQDLMAYADDLLQRFANPALNHRLAQIAMDGSQKIPQRWLETLAMQQQSGRQCPAILAAMGAWLCHVRGDNVMVDDPIAGQLRAAWKRSGESGIADALFGTNGLMASRWHMDEDAHEIVSASFA
jgi:fructuronate reductase